MTSRGHLVGFDIPGLQRYVFAPVRPLDVMGGSRLLERFADQARASAQKLGAEEIYSGGGHGVFIVGESGSINETSQLIGQWRRELADLTRGGVEVVAASVPLEGDFRSSRLRLGVALERERAARLLNEPSKELLPEGTHPSQVCRACGMEVATFDDPVGGDREAIGPQCQARRSEGRREGSVVLRELFGGQPDASDGSEEVEDPDRPPPGSVLTSLYLDADGLGRLLAGLDIDEVHRLSKEIRQRAREATAVAEEIAKQQGRRILAPIVGGDDVLLFLDARLVPKMVRAVLGALRDPPRPGATAGGAELRFSGSVVFADPYTPLRHLFEVARRSLKEAKIRAHQTGVPHLAYRSLLTKRLHPGAELLFGGPLPADLAESARGDSSPLEALVEAVLSIADDTQRVGLGRDLLGTASREEQRLAVDDRLARLGDRGLEDAVAEARRWSVKLGRDESEILLGALALAELWEDALR